MKVLKAIFWMGCLSSLAACNDEGDVLIPYASAEECEAAAKKIEAQREVLSEEIGYDFSTKTEYEYSSGTVHAQLFLNQNIEVSIPKPIQVQFAKIRDHQEQIDKHRADCELEMSEEALTSLALESKLIDQKITEIEESASNLSIEQMKASLKEFEATAYSYVVALDEVMPNRHAIDNPQLVKALKIIYLLTGYLVEVRPELAKELRLVEVEERAVEVLNAIYFQFESPTIDSEEGDLSL